jgi:hypothetical protein
MSYLTFPHIGTSSSGLTNVWDVKNTGQLIIGTVSWYAPWRRYGYTSITAHIVLDATCMREIADFCETQTRAHKLAKV